MMAPLISRTLEKVDKAIARLQDLQSSIISTRRDVEAYECSERLKIDGLSTSPRFQSHQFLDGCRKSTQSAEIFNVKEDAVPAISEGWKQWSLPAEVVHKAMLEIVVASKFAKDMAAVLRDSVELALEQENKNKSINQENLIEKPHSFSKGWDMSASEFEVVLPPQSPAGNNERCNDLEGRKAEYSKLSIDQTNSLLEFGSNTWQSSMPVAQASQTEAAQIKSAQKLGKVSFPTKAVTFPNQTFAPSPSSSLPLVRSSTPSRHENASNPIVDRKCLRPMLSSSQIKGRQRALKADKSQGLPVKPVSMKTKVISPASRTVAIGGKSQATSAVSGLSRQLERFRELPILNSISENKRTTKVSSLTSQLDTRVFSKKRQGLSTLSNVRSSSSLRPSKLKSADKSEGHSFCEQKSRSYEKKNARPRSSVLVKDKENFQIQGCTPAALGLKRNCFDDQLAGLLKNGSGGD